MALDYASKLTALHHVLSNANTTTAAFDMSTGLDSRIQLVSKADPAIVNLKNYQFPKWLKKLRF